MPTNNPT